MTNSLLFPSVNSRIHRFFSFKGFKIVAVVFALLLVSVEGRGQIQLSESFETGMPTSYTTSTATLGTGTWTGTRIIRGTTGKQTGTYCCQLESSTGSNIISPTIAKGGISTITFYASRSSSSGSALQVLISKNGGSFVQVGSTFNLNTTVTQYTATVNDASDNIQVQFYRTAGTLYIDDVVIKTAEPTTQTSAITFSPVSTTSMTVNWTSGNGGRRAVFMKAASGAITNPTDGVAYSASADWNSKGTQLGTSGYYCIYDGTGTSVSLTNLVASTTYYIQSFEYNSDNNTTPTATTINYFTSTATGNPNNQATTAAGELTAPTLTAAISPTVDANFDITFTDDATWRGVTPTVRYGLTTLTATTDYTITSGTLTLKPSGTVNGALRLAGTQTITVSATGYLDATVSQPIGAGAANKLQLLMPGETAAANTTSGKTGTPTAQVAGTAFNTTVNSTDQYWNVVSSTRTIAITSSDANATLPANAALAAGTGTYSVTFKTAAAATVTATDQSGSPITVNTGTSTSVSAGAINKLQLLMPGETATPGTVTGKTGTPNAQTAGTQFSVTVNAVDANWNLVTNTNTIAITSNDANAALPSSAALSGGTKTYLVTLKTAGSKTVTATNSTNGAITASAGASTTINVGAVSKLQLLMPGETAAPGTSTGKTGTPTAQTAGTSYNVTVNAVDANWNIVTSNTSTIVISSSDANAVLPANAALVAGTGTFSVTCKTAGSKTVTATDNAATLTANTGASTTISAGAFTKLQILVPGETAAAGSSTGKTGTPTGQSTGTALSVTVNAVDANWNIVSSTDNIAITSADGAATLPANATLVAGTKAFSVTLNTVASTSITATDVTDGAKTASTSPSIVVSLVAVPFASWDISTTTMTGAAPTATANANVTVGVLTRGSGVTTSGTAFAREWGGGGWTTAATVTEAVTAGAYLSFTIKPKSNYVLSFNNIPACQLYSSTTGPSKAQWQYSIDGTNFTSITDLTIVTGGANNYSLIDLSSISALQNVPVTTTVTFRIVAYNTNGSGTPTFAFYDGTASVAADFSVNGYISAAGPSITGTATATTFTNTYGTASSTQGFSVSGSNLTADLIATAPTGFQVANGAGTYGGTATFTQTAGTASGTLNVRLAANAVVGGTYNSQTISLTSTNATTLYITTAASGNTVSPKALTMSGLSVPASKIYDGSTTAVVTDAKALLTDVAIGTGTSSDGKPYTGDVVSITGTPLGTYNTKNVGATTVTYSGLALNNTNYSLTIQGTSSATITTKALTMSGLSVPASRAYDGGTTAVVSGTPALQTAEAVGVGTTSDGIPYTGDVVGFTGTAVGTYNSKDVASATTVTYSGLSLNNTNYSLTIQGTSSATITAKGLTISGLTANNKIANGNTTATLSGTPSLVGVVLADASNVAIAGTYIADFSQSTTGTGLAVTVSGYSLTGSAIGNYTLSQPAGLTADITSCVITGTATATAFTTIYGTASASQSFPVTGSGLTTDITATAPTGFEVSSDNSTFGTTATLANSGGSASGNIYVRLASTATVAGTYNGLTIVLSATGATNVNITSAASGNAVTAKALTMSGLSVPVSKQYDRLTSAVVTDSKTLQASETFGTGTSSDGKPYTSDVVSITGTPVGTYNTKDVATAATVTFSGLSLTGVNAGNYSLTIQSPASATITAKGLTVTNAAVTSKTYTGTNNATITGATLSGVISPDAVTLVAGSNTFNSVNVATGIGVTTNFSLTGTDNGNYSISQPTLTGNITVASLTITGLTGTAKVYDGSTSASFTGTAAYVGLQNNETHSVIGTPSASFATAAVNPNKTITITGYNAPTSNYSISANPTCTANITAKTLTMSGLSVPASKTYDGTTTTVVTDAKTLQSAEAVGAGNTIDGKPYTGDIVSITGTATGTYDNANVVSASTVTFGGLTLNNSNYSLTIQSPQAATITKANQSITGLNGTDTRNVGGGTYSLSATAPGGTVSYSSSTPTVASVSGSTVTIGVAGQTTITASQSGSANYNAAPDVTQTITVSLNTDFFRSKATGNWNATGTWESSSDGLTGWAAASTVPSIGNNVSILSTNVVTVASDASCKNLSVKGNQAGSITVSTGFVLTVSGLLDADAAPGSDCIGGTGTIKLTGTGAVIGANWGASAIFGNLTFDPGVGNSSSFSKKFKFTDNIVINSGTVSNSASSCEIYTPTTNTGAITINAGATFDLSNSSCPMYGSTTTTNPLLSVTVNGTLITVGNVNASTFTIASTGIFKAGKSTNFYSTASAPTMNFSGIYELNGVNQNIPLATYNTLKLNGSGTKTLVAGNITVNGTLDLTSGKLSTGVNTLTVGASGTVSNASSSSYVYGNLIKLIASGSTTKAFEIGDATTYAPVTLDFAGTISNSTGSIQASTASGDHAQIASSGLITAKTVNRTWTLTSAITLEGLTSYSPTFNYVTGDVDGTATTSNFVVKRYASLVWASEAVGTKNPTNTQATGVTGFGDFAIGEAISVPTLATTSTASLITSTTATSGGNVTSNGGVAVTASGICWSTTTGPTTALLTKTTNSIQATSYTGNMTGLSAATLYYVRSYATNSAGTSYGAEVSFTTLGTYSIAASAYGAGSVSGTGTKDAGATVTLTATPDNSTTHRFVNWMEGSTIVSSANPYIFTATAAKTLVANFDVIAIAIAGGTNTNASTFASCATCDMAVTGTNTTLSVDEPKEVKNVTVAAGSNLKLGSNTLTVNGDVVFSSDNTSSFSANIGTGSIVVPVGKTVSYVKYMDGSHWYFMSFPVPITVSAIKQANGSDIGTLGADLIIKYYDGANRASGSIGSNWKPNTDLVLTAKKGYIFGINNGPYSVKFPLPNSIVLSEGTTADSKKIPAAENPATNGANPTVHKGWNLVGQPFLSKYPYSGANVEALNMYFPGDITGTTYDLEDNSTGKTIDPFAAYFVQVNDAAGFSFDAAGRVNAPASVAVELSDRVQLNFTSTTGTDRTILVMDNAETTDYKIGSDFEKTIGTGTPRPQIYTSIAGVNYAKNALPMSSVVNLPVGVYTKTAGKTIISVDATLAPGLSQLLLTDTKATPVAVTDLLLTSYAYDATAGTDNTRFKITAQRVPTGIETINEGDNNVATIKMVNGKLLLDNLNAKTSVRVYDAIGRLVTSKTSYNNSLAIPLNTEGIYTIQLVSGVRSWTKKIVYNR
ncbi:MAG: YDG domain-containing protein [Paludibacter sp.]